MPKRHCACPDGKTHSLNLPVCRRCFESLPVELQEEWSAFFKTWHALDQLSRLRRMIRAYNAERHRSHNSA